jgi:hypothetical protein
VDGQPLGCAELVTDLPSSTSDFVLGRAVAAKSWSTVGSKKPRTVYEKAVQDFTETAQQLARLNQHFRQASFSEFEMLMGLDDEVLKRYGLPKPTVKRALLEVYQTVVHDQQR